MTNPIVDQNSTAPPESLIVEPASPAPEPSPDLAPASSPSGPDGPSDYERRLREENAEYRKRWGQYEELFDGFEDDDTRGAVEELVRLAKSGDPAAVTQVAEVFGLQVPEGENPEYMTRAEVEAFYSERDQERAQQSAVEDVYRQAESLGYKRDTEEMVRLLWHLNQQDVPDIQSAHEQISGERQKIIDAYLEEKRQTARETPRQSAGGGSVPNTSKPPSTPTEAREAALARFAANR